MKRRRAFGAVAGRQMLALGLTLWVFAHHAAADGAPPALPERVPVWPAGEQVFFPEVDLRPNFANYGLDLDDQNRRATCAVFALVSMLEYEWALRERRSVSLSEEFVVWAVREFDDPQAGFGRGFAMVQVAGRLVASGVPEAESYRAALGGQLERPPPPPILTEAKARAVPVAVLTRARATADSLFRKTILALNRGQPVAIGTAWPNEATLRTNATLDAQATPEAHAVLLVGYVSPTGNPDDVRFLFRNSWGRTWGVGGHGWMTARFFREHADQAFTVARVGLPESAPAPSRRR